MVMRAGPTMAALIAAPTALAEDKRIAPPDLTGLRGPEAEAFSPGTNAIIWGYPVSPAGRA
jgi:hypothetical protein